MLMIASALRLVRAQLKSKHPEFVEMEPLVSTGRSIIRWGDGESSLLLMRSIHFQRHSFRLALALMKLLISSPRTYTLCLPAHLSVYRDRVAEPRYRAVWAKTILIWEALSWRFDKSVSDAFAFRKESPDRGRLLSIVLNRCNIVCVVSKDEADALRIQDLTRRAVRHVACPSRHAYESLGKIRTQLLREIADLEPEKSVPLRLTVLVSAGPAGKILISDLTNTAQCKNVQFLDVGHMFDHGLEAVP
jgi:hypothetical protein